MSLRTPLYAAHLAAGAKMVEFAGFELPLHYGSQVAEHHAVRRSAGMFDVSHMAIIDLTGGGAREFLRSLLANDVARLAAGKALYSCMLLPGGGVIDDLIAYCVTEAWFRLVVNAGTRSKDLSWIRRHAADFDVAVVERNDLAMLAVQGPQARAHCAALLAHAQHNAVLELKPFCGAAFGSWFISRTGYTGEDGFELTMPAADAADAWERLGGLGVAPAGLGARDTLRLEAGMNLYGNDMDESHHPLESGLAWTVAFEPAERAFIGREALEQTRRCDGGGEDGRELVGLLLEERGVLRGHQSVVSGGAPVGEVTSGTFAPTLNRSVALARLQKSRGSQLHVEIRGKLHAARIVKPPFVRHGRILIDP